MEENSSMEWNMEWKIFSMEWKWNGRKLEVWIMEKSSSIPYHALAAPTCRNFCLHLLSKSCTHTMYNCLEIPAKISLVPLRMRNAHKTYVSMPDDRRVICAGYTFQCIDP